MFIDRNKTKNIIPLELFIYGDIMQTHYYRSSLLYFLSAFVFI